LQAKKPQKPFCSIIKFRTQILLREAMNLTDMEPCHFPRLGDQIFEPGRRFPIKVELQHSHELHSLFRNRSDAFGAFVNAAWALLLRCYAGPENVSFGYQEVHGGNHSRMMVMHLEIDEKSSLTELIEKSRDERAQQDPRPYQQNIFNTIVLLRIQTKAQTPNWDALCGGPGSISSQVSPIFL
jgi:hypothetical protein